MTVHLGCKNIRRDEARHVERDHELPGVGRLAPRAHEVDDGTPERRAVEHSGEKADDQRESAALVAADRQQHALADLLRIGDRLAGLAVHYPAFLQWLVRREVLPDDLPFVTGPIGLLGSMPSDEMVMNCDTFFMIGTSFPYAEWLPDEGSARGVEIDIDGSLIGVRYPMDAHLVGDVLELDVSSSSSPVRS